MEAKHFETPSETQLRHRKSIPDVPSDVDEDELMEHFNDPNYDFEGSSTAGSTFDSMEIGSKKAGSRWSASDDVSLSAGSETASTTWDSSRAAESKPYLSSGEITYNDESPYPEVRAAVSNTDDPSMPVNTFRMWFIGIIMSIIIPAFNTVFWLRYPTVIINSLFVQIIVLPFGKSMERFLPAWRLTLFGYSMSLNPGPFNVKEHTLISVMANVVVYGAPVTDIIATQTFFYNTPWGIGKQFVLGLAVQLLGFSFAGLVRQFLVWPSSMIWPGVLVRSALLNTMHKNYGKKETKHISRERFLFFACLCSFIWYWVPGFLFTALSIFNWVCWIAPNNIVVNTLFGYASGLGMGFLTFDWAMISYVGSPLVVPWWAQLNSFVSFVFWIWLVIPILWAKNVFFAKFMPISSAQSFDNTGLPYDPTAILTDGAFDEQKYQAYSPMYLTITFAITYGTCFASYTAVVVHTFLWYRHDIMRQFRRSMADEKDVHSRLMKVYPEVPRWWYAVLGIFSFVMGIIGIEICDTKLPVWAYVVAVIMAFVFVVPLGMVQAITNQQFTLNVLAEIVVGYMVPGRPLAAMVFKYVSHNSTQQTLYFVSDLKMGHYMKIPPRMMFMGQVVASVIAVFVSIGTQEWIFTSLPDICQPNQKDMFTCPGLLTFSTASLIWGGIGPQRLFSPGAVYYPIVWFFLIGALLPIPFYFLARRFPRSFLRYVHIPVALNALSIVPPASGINYSSWIVVGAIFQWFIRRFHFRWWMRYNYLLSSGLDAGVIFGLFIIFFTVQLPKGGVTLNWWGNTVWQKTADAMGLPFSTVAPGDIFGPTTWS
ncbi:oligopeptide transporter [Heterobasidion irregulare TC 32-1]|uniref:Oligopeptide transporter n=1 Tax=Heterobasidion irregulare (strain TC 32-1) TaxID=747525 RepID=W4KQC3_HETIT|nr:oligopeptide transporter [Heterobasidion irregulare TC 32-1]ETW87600.1 oligopeptide transporter [Heterobasidion irregulare TC 32-1]